MRILHFSDVHVREDFNFSDARKYGWRRTAALVELRFGGRARDFGDSGGTLANVARAIRELKPDHVIFSGDFTATATDLEFQEARRILGDLAESPNFMSAVPGNHDRYTPGSIRSKRYEKYFGHLITSAFPQWQRPSGFPFCHLVGQDIAVIGIATACLGPMPGISYGKIAPDELEALGHLLSEKEVMGRHVMLLMHHAPLNPKGRPDTPTHGLWGREKFLRIISAHPSLTIHCGHIHRRYIIDASAQCPMVVNPGSGTLHRSPGFFLIHTGHGGKIDRIDEVPVIVAG